MKYGLRGATGLALLSGTGALAAACGASTKPAASATNDATAGSKATTATTATTGASGGTSGGATAAGAPTSLGTVAMQLSWINNIEFAGSFIAKQKGYYAQQGVDVSLLTGGPSVESIPLLVAGKALVATGGPDTVAAANNEGAAVTMIGACYQRNPFSITSLTKKPIHVPTDMYGKRIGVQAANQVISKAFLRLAKLDASRITQVPVQFDPTPLASGEVDGWFSYYTNEPTLLRAKGVNVTTMLLEDFGYHELDQVYVTRHDSLSNPKELAQVTALMKGEILGWQDQLKDPALGAVLAVAEQTLEAGVAPRLLLRRLWVHGIRQAARTVAFFALSMALVFGLWMGPIKGLHLDPYFAKTPMDIWRYMTQGPDAGANRAELVRNLAITLRDAALGYGVGTMLAVAIAVAFVLTAAIERTFMPIAVALRSVPLVAMTPLLALVFGRGLLGVTVVAGIVTFFPTLVYVVGGLRDVPGEIMSLMAACGAGRWTIMRKVRFFLRGTRLVCAGSNSGPGRRARGGGGGVSRDGEGPRLFDADFVVLLPLRHPLRLGAPRHGLRRSGLCHRRIRRGCGSAPRAAGERFLANRPAAERPIVSDLSTVV